MSQRKKSLLTFVIGRTYLLLFLKLFYKVKDISYIYYCPKAFEKDTYIKSYVKVKLGENPAIALRQIQKQKNSLLTILLLSSFLFLFLLFLFLIPFQSATTKNIKSQKNSSPFCYCRVFPFNGIHSLYNTLK